MTNLVKGPPPPSYRQNTTTIPLATPALWFGKYYLSDPSQAANPLASPIRAKLAGLPPATIIYAAKLKAAGVRVTRSVYKGVTHEFLGMGAAVAKADSQWKKPPLLSKRVALNRQRLDRGGSQLTKYR